MESKARTKKIESAIAILDSKIQDLLDLDGEKFELGDGVLLGFDGLVKITKKLKYNNSVETLYLRGQQIGSEGAKELANMLRINSTLTHLFLRNNNLADEGVKILAKALKFSSLKTLDLQNNNFGDSAAKKLLECLKYNSTITSIQLAGNKISEEIVLTIVSHLKENEQKNDSLLRVVAHYLVDKFERKSISRIEEVKLFELYSTVNEELFFKFGNLLQTQWVEEMNRINEMSITLLETTLLEDFSLNQVELLLSKDANPNIFINGQNFCNQICRSNKLNLEILKLLVEKGGADFNIKDHDKKTCLHYACANKLVNYDIISFLCEKGDSQIIDKEGMNCWDYLKENDSIWVGELNEGSQWNGKGICFWEDEQKDEWVFEGKMKEGLPVDEEVFMICTTKEKLTLTVKLANGKKKGVGVLTEEGKEFFVEFNENGKEIVEKRKRTFEGIRLMIVGCQDVGKTSFKKRLLGILNDNENRKAYNEVQIVKREEEMTHGVTIDRLIDEKNKILFSIWDFAGHEEYHVAHSFFFSPGSVFLLLFDCSIEIEKLETQNKLLYWFHFLQAQVGENARLILIGTKFDLLQQKCSNSQEKINAALREINNKIKTVIEENQIQMKFHNFAREEETFFFLPLKNREFELEKAGVSSIYKILIQEYDSVENTVSTNLQHKIVFECIEKFSGLKNENPTPKKQNENNFANFFFNFGSNHAEVIGEDEIINSEIIPFMDVSELKKLLKEKKRKEALVASKNIYSILSDLHKLGVIVFFDHDILRETIICDPKWFNTIFKVLIDFGRKKIELIFEKIYHSLKKLEINGNLRINLSNHENSLAQTENVLKWICGRLPKFTEQNLIEEIWKNPQVLQKSIVAKVSFHTLMRKLSFLEQKLIEEGNRSVLDEFVSPNKQEICQTIHLINEKDLRILLNEILGEERKTISAKREYIVDLLVKFDLIIPRGKLKFEEGNKSAKKLQSYLIPFLFPLSKPDKICLFGKFNIHEITRTHEWKISYEIPFRPSNIWKMMFIKVRNSCVGSEETIRMIDEIYWIDGFLFNFTELKNMNESIMTKNSTIVEMEMIQIAKTKQIMEINILSYYDPLALFQAIHQSVKEFISKWILSSAQHQIQFKVTKKSIQEEDSINLMNKTKHYLIHKSLKALCMFCGISISLKEETQECENCMSKHFLIENQFAIEKIVAQGGQGRIYKARHKSTGTVVAIKERLFETENQNLWNSWQEEIFLLQFLEKKIPSFTTVRLISVLDDSSRNLKQKFIVMEWIEGQTLGRLEQKVLKNATFNSQKDFLRLMLILLYELQQLHNANIIHRDIKTENIMFIEKNTNLYFIFVDFGIAHFLEDDKEKIFVTRDNYKPAEINTIKEGFKSDLYALAKTLKEVLSYNQEIELTLTIETLIHKMMDEDIDNRPSVNECLQILVDYCSQLKMELDILTNSLFNQSSGAFKQPKLLEDIEFVRQKIEKEKPQEIIEESAEMLKKKVKEQEEEITKITEEKNQVKSLLAQKEEEIKTKNEEIEKLLIEIEKLKNK